MLCELNVAVEGKAYWSKVRSRAKVVLHFIRSAMFKGGNKEENEDGARQEVGDR